MSDGATAAMSKSVEAWRERAEYDLETARAMLKTGRFLYVLFCCQQAVEKALKALIVQRTHELPPRIHSLPRLAELSGLDLKEDMVDLFAELSTLYIRSRYPEELEAAGAEMTRERAETALRKTEEAVQWLFSMLR